MPEKTFNWGILGPGRISQQFAHDLQLVPGAALHAVASSNPQRAAEFAAKYNGHKTYDSYEALVADPEIDAVYIGTPHRFHFENTMLCLNAGKPVLCEKPITVNAAETQTLIETARAKNIFLLEALWTRFLPIYTTIRQWLDEGAVGDIHLITCTFGFDIPKGPEDRWLNPQLAGGTLLDMGIYPVSTTQWVMQGVAPSTISAKAILGATGVDELTAAVLQYPSGVIAQFSSNFLSNQVNDFFIYGNKGSIRIHPNFWASTKATLTTNGRDLTVTSPMRGGGFEYQTEEAMRCIRAGLLESPGMPHAHTLANMQLMDTIRAQIGIKYPFES